MQMSNISYRVYSIAELADWLCNGARNGLHVYCIAPTRAYALINNPCAQNDDAAIVVAFDGERPIGYSALFADEYISGNTIGRFFWGTTEWLEPEYRGKGIAGKMMRTLKESVGIDRYIGLESTMASVKLDQKQGASIELYNKLKFLLVAKGSLKGWLLTKYISRHNRRQLKRLFNYAYQNEYVRFVDAETYRFMESHSQNDLFLRQREMFNWILQYPFLMGIHDDPKAQKDICEFGSTVIEYRIEAIRVFVQEKLVGFYIVSQTNKDRTLRYLYYDERHKNEVFASVTTSLLQHMVERIYFISSPLLEFMHKHGIKHLNRKSYIDKIALTLPPGMSVDASRHIQGGDGDMFC